MPIQWHFTYYHTPSLELVRIAQQEEKGQTVSDNAAKLLLNWFKVCQKDTAMKHRLKLLAYTFNMDEVSIPSWCKKFNGKPVMVTKSCKIFRGPNNDYLELDVDMRAWGIMVKKGVQALIPQSLMKLKFALTFIIQGQSEDELPERAVNAIRISLADIRLGTSWPYE
mmetsp:Transcript_3387/g.3785  ORF Transcript_3387/g.3785 Transcript_3387/m.3785 type:complete len:167 (+) Transcript_3387:9-509(+)